jgi:hypothetical protein
MSAKNMISLPHNAIYIYLIYILRNNVNTVIPRLTSDPANEFFG